jgi:hypothetical protein
VLGDGEAAPRCGETLQQDLGNPPENKAAEHGIIIAEMAQPGRREHERGHRLKGHGGQGPVIGREGPRPAQGVAGTEHLQHGRLRLGAGAAQGHLAGQQEMKAARLGPFLEDHRVVRERRVGGQFRQPFERAPGHSPEERLMLQQRRCRSGWEFHPANVNRSRGPGNGRILRAGAT